MVTAAREKPAKKVSASNVINDPTKTLQRFDLLDLQQYTQEKAYATTASKDFHLFYVGRDDVHDILKHVLSRVSVSLYLNMFGFDDDELNDILMTLALFNTSVATQREIVIGQSATHQISHTKGFVADGKVAGEGSTNWSVSGEGEFVVTGKAGGPGYKAQNNTQSIITDPDTISRFSAELVAEHMIAKKQSAVAKK